MTGTTLETAIRVMTRWARQGLVATRRGGFVLARPPASGSALVALTLRRPAQRGRSARQPPDRGPWPARWGGIDSVTGG